MDVIIVEASYSYIIISIALITFDLRRQLWRLARGIWNS